jgi:hypothetical protein
MVRHIDMTFPALQGLQIKFSGDVLRLACFD